MNLNVNNLKISLAALVAGAALSTQAFAQGSTPVVGFVTTSMAPNSDTIIAPQVFRDSELSAAVSSFSSSPTQATFTLNQVNLTANQFVYTAGSQPKTYFALVTSGNLLGATFLIASNSSSSITVNLDGLSVSSADVTAIEVRPAWTLNTLFPLADANVSFTPSASQSAGARRTQLIMPNFTGTGVNRGSSGTYFFNNTTGVQDWVSTAASSTKAGDTAILPGSYVILRNTGGTPVSLSFTHSGAVFARPLNLYLGTLTNGANDTLLALPRPTDYTLAQLGIDSTAFIASTSTSAGGRRDTLIVSTPTGSGVNRASSATYFRVGTNWYSTAATTVITNNAVIPAGSAVIIRKVSSDGNDRVWKNELNAAL